MTVNEAKDYTLRHWNADRWGDDLDNWTLDEAFVAVFKRDPEAEDDVLQMLKEHFAKDLTEADKATIKEWGE